jgi:hypothetical protein
VEGRNATTPACFVLAILLTQCRIEPVHERCAILTRDRVVEPDQETRRGVRPSLRRTPQPSRAPVVEIGNEADVRMSCKHHHPLFTSGDNHSPSTEMRPIFDALYDNNAELVVTGHNHEYERFAPQNPSGQRDTTRGIRAFVVGTGGAGLYGFGSPEPNSEVRNSDTHGVLKLSLKSNGYDWEFIPAGGGTFTDSGSGSCH